MTGLAFDGTTGIVNATWTTLTRPGTAVAGQSGYNTDTGAFETFNGTTWGYTTGTWNTAGRPTNPVAGLTGFNTTYGGFEVWNGTAWSTISGGPAFSAVQSASSQSLSTGVNTKVTFNLVTFDTNSNFSASRFTPTVAGYYQISAFVGFSLVSSIISFTQVSLQKNGTLFAINQSTNPILATSGSPIPCVSAITYLNGTTDYIEVYCQAGFTGTASTLTGYTSVSGALIRGA